MNKILIKLESCGVKAVAYADDLVILVSGRFTTTISEITEIALRKISNWATSCGLEVNQSKTELMLFTNKYKIPPFTPPKLNGTTLSLSSSAKYLGVILDSKLSWKLNIDERVRKANIAFYSCSKTFGKKWGLKSRMILWSFTAIVRPILTYGSIVWWPALSKVYNVKKLIKVQRSACVSTAGALRSCPADALNIILHLLPLDLQIKFLVSCSALRLRESKCWITKPFGHSNLSDFLPSNLLTTPTDYCTPSLSPSRICSVIIPSRKEWEEDEVLRGFNTTIYTDGSKMESGVGAGIFSEGLGVQCSYRLSSSASVFQAEVLAILKACSILKSQQVRNKIAIVSDSQAAIKAIVSTTTSSKLVQQCRREIIDLNSNNNITLIWVPGHSGFEGNEKADELARQGSTQPNLPEEGVLIPLNVMKGILYSKFTEQANCRWRNLTSCVISRKIWPTFNKYRTNNLICRPRKDIARIVATCTGHWPLGEHAAKLGIPHNTMCRSCGDQNEKETVYHFLCHCPALAVARYRTLGKAFYQDITELSETTINELIAFLNAANWL